VLRTEKLDGGPEIAATSGNYAFRKRLDGGYTIAGGFNTVHEIVPDSFAFFRDFLPALRMEWKTLSLRFGERFLTEFRTPKRWSLDEETPFERTRILDPAPVTSLNDEARARLSAAFPVFAQARVAQQWAGMVDVTPDAVPVISPVESIPGFFVGTGFSGHGFGIGPGAGRLMADLVTGAPPIVDPSPFRFSRFTDGSHPRPVAGI
jgi:glycine/D-amino acid oxidase-like deaminating enzyme